MTLVFKTLRLMMIMINAILTIIMPGSRESVEVELYSNPTSGYSWEYEMDRIDVLAISESYYVPDFNDLFSGGGKRVFKFTALTPGIVHITFTYEKILDFSSDIASKYVYTYEVLPSGEIELISVV